MKVFKLIFISIIASTLAARLSKGKAARKTSARTRKLQLRQRRLVVKARKLIKKGKENFRKLNLKLKKDPNYIREKSRKLVSGYQMLGLLGGLGGYMQHKSGQSQLDEFKDKYDEQERYQNMHLMMKINKKKGQEAEMEGHLHEIEDRINDLSSQISGKIYQLKNAASS